MPKRLFSTKIGVLGGGQLARMLVLKGHELGFDMFVLSPNKSDSAAQVTQNWVKGSPDHAASLRSFLKKVDVATFESEFLNAELLRRIGKEESTSILPRASLMGQLQDRLKQKQLLSKAGIPSTDYIPVASYKDAQQAFLAFPHGMVLKQRRFGYDGYGTFVVRKRQDLLKHKKIIETNEHGFIAESLVWFKREMALSLARNKKGQIVHLPLVETFQKNSRCFWVKGPSQHRALAKMLRKIKKFLNQINYQGVIAFEMFDLGSELTVNEIAPRVHNSAHYSLDVLLEDQFTLHLKAIANQSLAQPISHAKGFAMLNLLGHSSQLPDATPPGNVKMHWYGKHPNKPGRKMGHINAIGPNPSQALKKLLRLQREFKI